MPPNGAPGRAPTGARRTLRPLLAGVALLVGGAGAIDAQTLQRGNGPEPASLDAHRCSEVACGNILRDLYEGLVSEDAFARPIPGIAHSWRVADDGLRWEFELRENLRWSNGEPLDAAQVVASLQRALDPATAAAQAELLAPIVNAAAIRRGELPPRSLGVLAPDARTVVFELSQPAPLERLLTLSIAYPVYLPAIDRFGTQHTRPGRLVSNGAFRLHAWTPQSAITLQRNPHFREPAMLEAVRYHVTEDAATEVKRFQAGDLHVTETVPPTPLPRLRERFGGQLRIAPYLGSFHLGFNLTRAPFEAAPALREALSLAVDREILTRYVTALGELPAYGVVPPLFADYPAPLPDWAQLPREQREARARQRYAQAGYSPQRPLQVELRYNTSTPHRRMALAVAAMWREVLGVQARLRNEEWRVFVQNRRQRVITQVFRGGWIADVGEPLEFLLPFRSDARNNATGFADPQFDALLDAAQLARGSGRDALLAQAEARLLAQHAVLPLYHYTSKHLVDARLRGWHDNPLDRHPSRWLSWAE